MRLPRMANCLLLLGAAGLITVYGIKSIDWDSDAAGG